MIYKTSDYNIDSTGKTLVTESLQSLIDEVSFQQGTLILTRGTYLVSSLFLRSNMHFIFEKDACLLATTEEEVYPILPTRVAGIEMPWYVGVLNCLDVENVQISGNGIIHGNGPYWWEKYWGKDTKGGMRKIYDQKNLRWACDYDCKRVRNVVVNNSKNIVLKDFTSYQSGFWNVHILYSHDILIDNIQIEAKGFNSPSTDGIDIDSSYDVTIQNCTLHCNDDSICIKSGRDFDGLRVNRPSHHIKIQHCQIYDGFGITIGSEVSGGVYDILIEDIKYKETDCGFRIKSSQSRKGYVRDIVLKDLEMQNVKYLFHFFLNWNPMYNECQIPKEEKNVPEYWYTLTKKVDEHIKNTKVEHIQITNVKAYYDGDYDGISRAFMMEGFADSKIEDITFENVNILCKEYGLIQHTKDIHFKNFTISCTEKRNAKYDEYDNR